MPLCEGCGREVRTLTEHAMSKQRLCLRCMTRSGLFKMDEDRVVVFKDDRRGSIRIPITVGISITTRTGKTASRTISTFGANISTTGVCFTWSACRTCTGYLPSGLHPKCFFFHFRADNPNAAPLHLGIQVTKTHIMRIDARVAYTLKDEALGVEYVGAQFTHVSSENHLILEKIIMEYGLG